MSKQESVVGKQEDTISVCDIMKDDTSAIIHNLESQVPTLVQNYSDLYAAYLHMYDDLFGTCYIAEKEYFDKLKIDQGVLKELKKISESIRDTYIQNMDIASKMLNQYVKMRISTINTFDNYVHNAIESYGHMFSQLNKSINNSK